MPDGAAVPQLLVGALGVDVSAARAADADPGDADPAVEDPAGGVDACGDPLLEQAARLITAAALAAISTATVGRR